MPKPNDVLAKVALALRRLRRAAKGTVGIGTMIVFIASVLVAAIAAAVLIDTSSKLQERSSRTGNEATEQVSSNMGVYMLIGKRDTATSQGITDLEIYLSLSPGSRSVDLSQLRIQLKNGTTLKTFNHVNGAPTATAFNATSIRDADKSFSSKNPVMTTGDLAKVWVDLTLAGSDYKPRNAVTLVLIPEIGNKVVWGFHTPASYGKDTVIELS